MSKKKDITVKQAATAVEPNAKLISVKNIRITGLNARKVSKTQKSVKDLSESIRAIGLLQPISVATTDTDLYDLVTGERRFVACQLAGMTEIPAIVRTMTKEELVAHMFAENAERENLTPIEESNAIALLTGSTDEFNAAEVAAELGWSVTKVLRRRKLRDLIPEIVKVAEENHWTVAMMEYVAAFPENFQNDVLGKWWLQNSTDLEDLHQGFGNMMKNLSEAPFDTNIPMEIIPPCTLCPKQTGAQPELFEEDKELQKNSRCLDGECWKAKCQINIDQKIRDNAELIQIMPGTVTSSVETELRERYPNALPYSRYDVLTKSKASHNAVYIGGPLAGKTCRIKEIVEKQGSVSGKQKVNKPVGQMTEKEAKEQLKEKRNSRLGLLHKDAQDRVKSFIFNNLVSDPSKTSFICGDEESGLIALAFTVGVTLREGINYYNPTASAMAFYGNAMVNRELEYGHAVPVKIADRLKDLIVSSIHQKLGSDTGSAALEKIKRHTELCLFLGLDYETFVAEAQKDQKPEPKGWDALKHVAGEKGLSKSLLQTEAGKKTFSAKV